MTRSTFLVARAHGHDVGLETGVVARVVPAAEWAGVPTVDLELVSTGEAAEDTAVHVIVVNTATGERAFATARPLTLRDCPSSTLCDLPSELWPQGTRPVVSRVACEEGQPPLLILDVAAIGHDQPVPVLSGDQP
jgi:hypothetical protein